MLNIIIVVVIFIISTINRIAASITIAIQGGVAQGWGGILWGGGEAWGPGTQEHIYIYIHTYIHTYIHVLNACMFVHCWIVGLIQAQS